MLLAIVATGDRHALDEACSQCRAYLDGHQGLAQLYAALHRIVGQPTLPHPHRRDPGSPS